MHMCHHDFMAKMLQVRNIPDRLHRELRRRANARGQTLTEFVQEILEREVATPPREEVFERIQTRGRTALRKPVAEVIKEERSRRAS
ncbi:MAG: FitA-like ribbon-helix-helix domain-containing protein [Actinomycetota bacterium]